LKKKTIFDRFWGVFLRFWGVRFWGVKKGCFFGVFFFEFAKSAQNVHKNAQNGVFGTKKGREELPILGHFGPFWAILVKKGCFWGQNGVKMGWFCTKKVGRNCPI
jgi:hypothetical protein